MIENPDELLTKTILYLGKEEIGRMIGPDEEAFRELIDISFSRRMPQAWRAMWLSDYLSELHPWLAETYIFRIWSEIPKEHPVGVTRSALRMVCRYDIPEEYQGIITDLCLDWLIMESVPVAIKVYSMELLLKIARIFPELCPEFMTIIEDQIPFNSVGYQARSNHILKAMRKIAPQP